MFKQSWQTHELKCTINSLKLPLIPNYQITIVFSTFRNLRNQYNFDTEREVYKNKIFDNHELKYTVNFSKLSTMENILFLSVEISETNIVSKFKGMFIKNKDCLDATDYRKHFWVVLVV